MALCVRRRSRRRGKGWHEALRGCCLIPLKFNKQLPGMKRDASVYLYKRERERDRERQRIVRERERERGEVIWTRTEGRGERKKKGWGVVAVRPPWRTWEETRGDAPKYTVFPINYVWSGRFVQRDARNPKNLLFAKFTGLDKRLRWQQTPLLLRFPCNGVRDESSPWWNL